MTEYVTLTAPLYDRRDPNRPPVFIAAAGRSISREVADRFGGEYVTTKKVAPSQNKKRMPAQTKKA